MSENSLLFTCASWEDRFRIGIERDLRAVAPRKVVVFYYDLFAPWSADNRALAVKSCSDRGIAVEEVELKVDSPPENWAGLQRVLAANIGSGGNSIAHVDISTMPRELIWSLFWSLEAAGASVRYTYHRPEEYHPEWLSRDPGKPRFVYKMSGLTKLGQRTALVVLTGFDVQRTAQLIRFFEPAISLVGLQSGDLNPGNAKRMQEQREQFSRDPTVSLFEIDSFATDHGKEAALEHIESLLGKYNVVVSSLGPKLGSVALYQIHRLHSEIGITYTPSREFNREYSRGCGSSFTGQL
jgi:hypothetical protein